MSESLELVLAKYQKAAMLEYMAAHPEDFDKALTIAAGEEPHLNWRAAWLVTNCMEDNDQRIQPHLDTLVSAVSGKEDGHQRELMKILLRMELNEDHESFLFDHSVMLWESVKRTHSVRYIAFRIMVKVAEHYPELKHEVLELTQPQYVNSLSPGIRNSIQKMITALKD